MAGTDLDDILARVSCPSCRTVISVAYRQIRLLRAAGCSCGALIRIEDDSSIGRVQALIDEIAPIIAVNDGR